MNDAATAREALVAQIIGDLAALLKQAEVLVPLLGQACEALVEADDSLRQNLAGIESRMSAISENAKARVVQHLAAHADKVVRQSVVGQTAAINEAARAAISHALGASLLSTLQQRDAPRPADAYARALEGCLTHVAAAAAGAAAACIVFVKWVCP